MQGTTTPNDRRERELYWKRQRTEPRKSSLVEYFRQASRLQGMDGFEISCGVCSHVNLLRTSDPEAVLEQHYCERCQSTLAFSDRTTLKPIKMMKPIGQRLLEASERNAYRAASEKVEEGTPFWMIRPKTLEREY